MRWAAGWEGAWVVGRAGRSVEPRAAVLRAVVGSSPRHSPFTPSRCKGSSDKTSDYAAPIEHSACLPLLVSKADVADQAHDGPLTRALEKLYKRKFIPV